MAEEGIPEAITKGRNGIPLTSLAARPIIRWLFDRDRQWRRKELAEEVERIHTLAGGTAGKQTAIMVTKKALRHLAEEGVVESVPNGFGLWRRAGAAAFLATRDSPDLAQIPSVSEDDEDQQDFEIREKLGAGPESVYLYFNPNDQRLAELEERSAWECKIGRTVGEVHARILDQGVKTALSHTPVIGLVIMTPDSAALERALHASLRLADQTVEDSPGSEWFTTSPDKVKAWYQSFTNALDSLKPIEADQVTQGNGLESRTATDPQDSG